MSEILLSAGVRSNLLVLQQITDLMTSTQTRLATGKRVNTALDSPTKFFTALTLNNRADDLNIVLDGISNAFKILESADTSLTALTNLVSSAQSVANSALASVGTTANRTGTVANLTAATSFTVSSGTTFTIADGTTTATITSTGSVTVQQFLDGVNNTAGLAVKASLTANGSIKLEATGTNTIVFGGTASTSDKAKFGFSNATTAAGTLNATRSSLAAQFDATLTQIDQLANDAAFNGVNLLKGGSLKVSFNETSTSQISISGVTDDAAGLGLTVSTNTWQTDKDIQDKLTTLITALATLRSQANVFASNVSLVQAREEFTKSIINTLKSAADGLVVSDQNEEGANLLALQTRQSLSTTALSLAAQADQNVLRVLGL